MVRKQTPVGMWSQYIAARVAAMILGMFDVQVNQRTAAACGRALFRFDQRHRERACRSIGSAFPQWNALDVERTAQASFEHFVQLVVEVCHTPRILCMDTWPRHVRLANLGPVIELLNRGQPMIMLTGHVGNWEVLGYWLGLLGHPVEAIARPIDNPLINQWLLGIRQHQGLRIITKWNATNRMIDVLKRGGVLGFVADQNAGDKGLFVPFFGRLASTYKSIGLLAIDQQVPIVCGYAHRIGPGFRYEMGMTDLIQPSDWADQADPLYYITARYCRAIELMVRARPEQYLWVHRRWKSRPRHEREGKPFPKSLRQNLELLPWIDQTQVDRLVQSCNGSLTDSGSGPKIDPRLGVSAVGESIL